MTYFAAADRYETMSYNRVGESGLRLPALSLGLWQNFGDDRPLETQRAIIRRAFDLGITHFDLANNYGNPPGSAETNFSRILREDLSTYRDELIISTKAGFDMWPGPYGNFGSRKHMLASLDQSLTRLGVDYVDIFYSHRPDPETPIQETVSALADAVRAGKALYVGISNYDAEQTRAAYDALAGTTARVLIHQPRYSMFDRRVEEDVLPVIGELGLGSIVFSPLAQGMLTDRYLTGIPDESRVVKGKFLSADLLDDTYFERVRALTAIAQERGQSLAQLALSWVLAHPHVTSALVGASSVGQLEQNVVASYAPTLTDEELQAIDPYAVDGTGRL